MPTRELKPQSLESSTSNGRILEIAVAVWVVPEAECQQVTRDVFGLSPEAECQQEGTNHNRRNLNRKGRSIEIVKKPLTSNADSSASRRKGVTNLHSTNEPFSTTRRLAPFVREQALGEVLREMQMRL